MFYIYIYIYIYIIIQVLHRNKNDSGTFAFGFANICKKNLLKDTLTYFHLSLPNHAGQPQEFLGLLLTRSSKQILGS